MEAGPCLLTKLRAARARTTVAGEVHQDVPSGAGLQIAGNGGAAQIAGSGAGLNAKANVAARCSLPRSRGCLSRRYLMT